MKSVQKDLLILENPETILVVDIIDYSKPENVQNKHSCFKRSTNKRNSTGKGIIEI